jgi:hypothetical protein
MGTFRFALLAVGLFALAFIGMSWASKGFPVMATRSADLAPDAHLGTVPARVEPDQRKDGEASKTSQGDGNRERDKVRMDLLQASTAYKRSPCDATNKKNLVAALTSYVDAWRAMAYCRPGVGSCPKSGDDAQATAANTFKTPLDLRAQEAMRDALEQGGISIDEFPRSLRTYVFLWTGAPPAEPPAACNAARQAKGR